MDVRERNKHNFTKKNSILELAQIKILEIRKTLLSLGRGREVRVGLKYVTDTGLPDMRGHEIH